MYTHTRAHKNEYLWNQRLNAIMSWSHWRTQSRQLNGFSISVRLILFMTRKNLHYRATMFFLQRDSIVIIALYPLYLALTFLCTYLYTNI